MNNNIKLNPTYKRLSVSPKPAYSHTDANYRTGDVTYRGDLWETFGSEYQGEVCMKCSVCRCVSDRRLTSELTAARQS